MVNKNELWKRILTYYLIAVGFTYAVGFLIIAKILPNYFNYITCYGPMIGAFVMFSLDHQFKEKIKELLRIRKPLWVWIGGTSPLWISLVLILVLKVTQYPLPAFSGLGEVAFLGNISFLALPFWIITSGIGEEFGWRGFLYPELRKRYSILITTLIMWPLWLLWHLPFFFYLPGYANMGVGMLFGFAFSLLSGAILLNWFFEKSGRSLPTTMLWHGTFNVVTASAFGTGNVAIILSMIVIFFSIAVVFTWVFPGKKSLPVPSN
jgi:uncharacterized protein